MSCIMKEQIKGQVTLTFKLRWFFTKWGNHDGNAYDFFEGSGYEYYNWISPLLIIEHCIQEYVLPEFKRQGFDIKYAKWETSHNPWRINEINGLKVDHYDSSWLDNNNIEFSQDKIEVTLKEHELKKLSKK